MLSKNFFKISLLSILSILLIPVNSFSMMMNKEKTKKHSETLDNIYNEQTKIINLMRGSFRLISYYKPKSPCAPSGWLYKNKEKVKRARCNILCLSKKILKTKKTSSKMSKTDKEKLKEINKDQKKLETAYETLESTEESKTLHPNRCSKILNNINSLSENKETSYFPPRIITTKRNECSHPCGSKVIIKDEYHCSLCNGDSEDNETPLCPARKVVLGTIGTIGVVVGVAFIAKWLVR